MKYEVKFERWFKKNCPFEEGGNMTPILIEFMKEFAYKAWQDGESVGHKVGYMKGQQQGFEDGYSEGYKDASTITNVEYSAGAFGIGEYK